MTGSRSDGGVRKLRQSRLEDYQRAAEAITDGDADLAEVHIDCAERALRKDVKETKGALLSRDEPHSVTVRDPEPAPPEETELLVVWYDLIELLETDPVIDQGDVGGRGRVTGAGI